MSEQDIEPMIEMGAAMHAESAFASLDYSWDKCRKLGHRYIQNPDVNFGVVAESDGKTVGMLMGYITDYYFGNDRIACDILWYIDPDYRGSRAAIKLLRAFQHWAKEQGASEVCIGVSTAVEFERTGLLLQRLGYTHVGGNYKLSVVG
jgi:RimJ/RimL family protein N-acetyltransferase